MLRWDEILGQERARDVLRRAVERDRVHHGFLFVGPDGVGKFATALSFTRILLCDRRAPQTFAAACGECRHCRKIQNDLQHPDVRVIVPEGGVNKFIKIEHVRALQKFASMKPYEARHQIALLDGVHRMTDEAANALLKTLEEPPPTMHLFLVTDQPQSLLDTIRSRCQTIRFGALSVEHVHEVLRREDEGELTDEELVVAAAFGEGSPGRARALLDAGIVGARRELFERIARLSRRAPASLLNEAEELAKDRKTLTLRLDLLKVLLRDTILYRVRGPEAELVNRDLEPLVRELSDRFDVDGIVSRIDAVTTAQDLLSRNVNPTMVLENLLTELAEGPVRAPITIPRTLR